MPEILNIYKEGDKIIIDDDLLYAELPYSDELWRKLDGVQTYEEDSGWLIDGIELTTIIAEETDKEIENVFLGTVQVAGIDERRELYVVGEGDVFRIVGIDPGQEMTDTEVISDSLRGAVIKGTEIWGDEESDLQLSEEAEALRQDIDKLEE